MRKLNDIIVIYEKVVLDISAHFPSFIYCGNYEIQ